MLLESPISSSFFSCRCPCHIIHCPLVHVFVIFLLLEDGVDHLARSGGQDGQEGIAQLWISLARLTKLMMHGNVCAYPVSSLAAALQPDTGALGNGAGLELDLVISADSQLALALLRVDVPAGHGLAELGSVALGDGLGQHGPGILEDVDVGVAPVASGSDDEVNLENLLVSGIDVAVQGDVVDLLDADLDLVTLLLDAGDLAAGKDTMRPLGLVGANQALLLIHLLVEVLDQVQAHNTVVGGADLIQEALSGGSRPGVDVVDVLGVEDGVDAVRDEISIENWDFCQNWYEDLQGRVITRSQELLAHEEGGLGVGV